MSTQYESHGEKEEPTKGPEEPKSVRLEKPQSMVQAKEKEKRFQKKEVASSEVRPTTCP